MKLFISYSRDDITFARKLRRDLTSIGYDVWMDEKAIRVGSSICTSIQDGLSNSNFVLLVISPESLSSGWVNTEWSAVFSNQTPHCKIQLLPILRKHAELPFFLKDIFYADASKNYATAFGQIVQAVEQLKTLEISFQLFKNNESFQKHFPLSEMLSEQGQHIIFCGFTHATSLFNFDNETIIKWIRQSRKFEVFMAKPEHKDQTEWLPRIKFYRKKYSYNQIDGAVHRCKNIIELLKPAERKKFQVYFLDLPRVNLLNLKKICGHYFCRLIGFNQMGNVSPVLCVKETDGIASFFQNYIDNLRKYDEFHTKL